MKKLPNTASDAGSKAREQAQAYNSLLADQDLELEDGSILKVPPHPDLGMMDDEQMEAYEELLVEVESYDREPDIVIPEQKLRDPDTGHETGVVLPAETQRGALKRPYRKDGKLVKPPHSVRVVQAVLGPEKYAALRAGGRGAKDVWRLWGEQGLELRQRQANDSKSDGSSVDLEPVSAGDSE